MCRAVETLFDPADIYHMDKKHFLIFFFCTTEESHTSLERRGSESDGIP